MSPDQQFWLAILAQVAALIIGLATIWSKLNQVHVQVNSRMDQLLKLTATSSHAEGVADGAAREEPPATS